MLRAFLDNSGLLVAGTVLALVWANLIPESYERVTHDLHFLVNGRRMAFFFALAAKEVVEATAPGGALHSPRRAALPLVAALGGMLGPALIYVALALVQDPRELLRGWAIACDTDIAFSYLVAGVIFGTAAGALERRRGRGARASHLGLPSIISLTFSALALKVTVTPGRATGTRFGALRKQSRRR